MSLDAPDVSLCHTGVRLGVGKEIKRVIIYHKGDIIATFSLPKGHCHEKVAISSASAASCPSTYAFPAILNNFPLRFITVSSKIS